MVRTFLALILASLAFSTWGYIWYATVFDDVWQALIGVSEEELIAMTVARGPIQDVFVILISVPQAIAIYAALKWVKARTFIDYMSVSLGLSTLVVLPALGNATLFAGTPLGLLILDYGHFLLGYAGMALVFYILAPREKSARSS